LEVAFNNMMRSTRHESGYALRFPRIVRLRPTSFRKMPTPSRRLRKFTSGNTRDDSGRRYSLVDGRWLKAIKGFAND
jgi:hypothetical protein